MNNLKIRVTLFLNNNADIEGLKFIKGIKSTEIK